MIRRFLRWLTARLPVKVIGREAPYYARPRSAKRFDDWHLTAPKGRDIREELAA